MKMKVLVIAPYEGLKELICSVSADFSDMDIHIEDGNMHQGVKSLKLYEEEQYDLILSRGETAALLRKKTDIPVLEIGISSLDIMHAILLSKNFAGKTALIAFPSIADAARLVLYGIEEKVDIITLNHAEEIDEILEALKKRGCQTIIGDVFASQTAAQQAFNSILLTSGRESVHQTFLLAESIRRNTEKYKKNLMMKQHSTWFQTYSDQNDQHPLSVLGSFRIFLEDYISLAQKYSQTEGPVTIIGERGTGKTQLARLIHAQAGYDSSIFIRISCDVIPQDGFAAVAAYLKENLSRADGMTLFFDNIDSLDNEKQKEWLSLIEMLPPGTCRLTASFTCDPATCTEVTRKIVEVLGPYRISIQPLRKCPEKIPEIAGQFISEANQKLGRQIVAIEEAGIRLLQAHHWTDNLNQLERVIMNMCMMSDGPVITAEETRSVLCREPEGEGDISLDGTLEEITLRIIREVLRQENGSITKTAKRLGISRSTLWRRLGNDQKSKE